MQYLKDILRISGDFMNTKDRHHIDNSFNVKYPNVYTHAHIQTVVGLKYTFFVCVGEWKDTRHV